MEVLNELNPDLDEKLYERALIIELRRNDHGVETQRSFPLYYREQLIGNLARDLIVDTTIIMDAKMVATFTEAHVAQMIGYLAITRLELALLLKFKSARLQWKRVVRQPTAEGAIPDLHA
ncbi:MAG: GxxExxY protein [Chthoniobacterales bacterium]